MRRPSDEASLAAALAEAMQEAGEAEAAAYLGPRPIVGTWGDRIAEALDHHGIDVSLRAAQPAPSASADAAWHEMAVDYLVKNPRDGDAVNRFIARHRDAIEAAIRADTPTLRCTVASMGGVPCPAAIRADTPTPLDALLLARALVLLDLLDNAATDYINAVVAYLDPDNQFTESRHHAMTVAVGELVTVIHAARLAADTEAGS